jgi:arsenate reductase
MEMLVVIHHNPDCGTSRNTLAIIEAAGYRPHVVEYLKSGWSRPHLLSLLAATGNTPRDFLREKGTPAAALGLLEADDETIIAAMVEHPVLVNRPIVCTSKGVRLCRPSETVLDLLDTYPPGPWYKEDGSLVIDASGQRLG